MITAKGLAGRQWYRRGALLFGWLLLGAPSASASPTGLNNISTTDLVDFDFLVLQYYANIPPKGSTEQWLAFKYGLFHDVEIGADWKVNDDPSLHAVLQAKYRVDPNHWWPDCLELPKFVVGFANLNDDRASTGPIAPYLTASYDLGIARLHAGFDFQHENEAFFAGVDRSFKLWGQGFTPRADVRQINDRPPRLAGQCGVHYDIARTVLTRVLGQLPQRWPGPDHYREAQLRDRVLAYRSLSSTRSVTSSCGSLQTRNSSRLVST